jgi:hypothetical protein
MSKSKTIKIMKKNILFSTIILILIAPNLMGQMIVKVKPQRPAVVIVTPNKSIKNKAWIEGHWAWSRKSKNYRWVKGRWVKSRKNQVWVTGKWSKVPAGWKYTPGRWSRT